MIDVELMYRDYEISVRFWMDDQLAAIAGSPQRRQEFVKSES